MILKQTLNVDIDPQDIVENQNNSDILEFILKLDEALESEEFTMQLTMRLLKSLNCPKNIISMIQAYYGIWVID